MKKHAYTCDRCGKAKTCTIGGCVGDCIRRCVACLRSSRQTWYGPKRGGIMSTDQIDTLAERIADKIHAQQEGRGSLGVAAIEAIIAEELEKETGEV